MPSLDLIGLNGLKGSGKDTVGQYLVERYGYVRLSFADALKRSAATLFDIPAEAWDELKNDPEATITLDCSTGQETVTARQFLQRYGTEAHRDVFGEDFWVDALFRSIPTPRVVRGRRKFDQKYVITDARFENELIAIRARGGVIIRINRPDVEEGDTHRSEEAPNEAFVNLTLDNTGTIEQLYDAVDWLFEEVYAV